MGSRLISSFHITDILFPTYLCCLGLEEYLTHWSFVGSATPEFNPSSHFKVIWRRMLEDLNFLLLHPHGSSPWSPLFSLKKIFFSSTKIYFSLPPVMSPFPEVKQIHSQAMFKIHLILHVFSQSLHWKLILKNSRSVKEVRRNIPKSSLTARKACMFKNVPSNIMRKKN